MAFTTLNPSALYDPQPYGMSQATIDPTSGLLFVSGQVAWDQEGRVKAQGYAAQTRAVLDNLSVVLDAAGCAPHDVLSVRVYLRGECSDHLPECVPVLASYFGGSRPALTGIGVASLASPDTLVEIEAVARVPGSR